MTSGNSTRLFRLAAPAVLAFVLVLGWTGASAGETSSGWSLEQLMRGLSEIKNATTDYTEDQYIGILTKPLHSSGKLVYSAPDRLEKNTLMPSPQSVVIDGDTLTMRQGNGRPRSVTLSDHPEVGAFVESLRSTLSGDLTNLNRFYHVGFTGSEDRWQLTLDPTDEKVKKLIKTVRIEGSVYSLRSVEITQADGDRSVMTMPAENGP
jgi:outer membrane lipoprotein-sorting protein